MKEENAENGTAAAPGEAWSGREKTFLEVLSGRVHAGLESFFYSLTSIVVMHPCRVIVVALLFVIVMAQGVWFYSEELAQDKQFSPRDSQAVKEEEWVLDVFGTDKRPVSTYFKAENAERNVLTRTVIRRMFAFKNWVENDLSVQLDGNTITYDTVCSRFASGLSCRPPRSVLDFWDNDPQAFEADPDFLSTINGNWRAVQSVGPDLDYYLSGIDRNASGFIMSARASRLDYLLRNLKVKKSGEGEDDFESAEFEIQWARQTRQRREEDIRTHGVSIHTVSIGEEDHVAGEATSSDVSSLVIGYVLMVFYAAFVLSRGRIVESHAMLGFASVCCVGLSTFSAYGFCWYLGIKFNSVVQVLILVLLGIGVDDTFVIMESWWENAQILDFKERMKCAVSHAGAAITITSCTDLIAFLAGSSTSFPALQAFCYYAAVGIAFDFVFQCTMFVAIAYLDTIREYQSRPEVACCVIVSRDAGVWVDGPPCVPEIVGRRGLLNHAAGTAYPRFLVGTVAGKATALLCTTTLLVLGAYGCSELKMNFSAEWFVPGNDPLVEDFDVRDQYFKGTNLPVSLFFRNMDFASVAGQEAVHRTVAAVQADPCAVPSTASSWLIPFALWSAATHPLVLLPNGSSVVSTFPSQALPGVLLVEPSAYNILLEAFTDPTKAPPEGLEVVPNVAWWYEGEERVSVRAARGSFLTVSSMLEEGEAAVDCMASLRDAAASVPLPAGSDTPFPWSFPFVFFESYRVMVDEITQNVAIAGASVFVLVTLLIANLMMGLIVALMIACVDTCLLGFMYWVGVDLNAVSIICIVVAIGFAVDYSVHVAHAFLLVDADDKPYASAKTQRAAYALWKMGPPVVNGGISTFIAIIPLSVAVSYIFQVFFKMFLLIILFGMFFGFVTLPVLLSFLGPRPYTGAVNLKDLPWMNPLDPTYDSYKSAPPPPPPPEVNKVVPLNQPEDQA